MTQSHGSKIILYFCDQDRQAAEEQILSQGWPKAGSSLFDFEALLSLIENWEVVYCYNLRYE